MEYLKWFVDYILHLNQNMGTLIQQYGTQIYGIMFLIIIVETGVVVFPFLPGDSLLFTAGSFAAIGQLNGWKVFSLLWFAAVLGDNTNYWIGRNVGPKAFKLERELRDHSNIISGRGFLFPDTSVYQVCHKGDS